MEVTYKKITLSEYDYYLVVNAVRNQILRMQEEKNEEAVNDFQIALGNLQDCESVTENVEPIKHAEL